MAGTPANRIDAIDDAGSNKFVTLNMVGGQDLRVDGAIGTSVKTVDASGMDAGTSVDVSVSGLSAYTFTGSEGDDTIRAGAIPASATIKGEGGTADTLEVTGDLGAATLSGIEVLNIKDDATPAAILTNAQEITEVNISGSFGAITDLSFTGLPPNPTIKVTSDNAVAVGSTSDFAVKTGTTDTLNLEFAGLGAVVLGSGGTDVVVTGYSTLDCTFNSGPVTTGANTSTFNDAAPTLKTIVFRGSASVTLGGSLLSNGGTTWTDLDCTNMTGVLNTGAASAFGNNPMTVKCGSNNDVVTMGNAANTVNGNDGADQLTGGTVVDTINGGNGNDIITGNTGADILSGGGDADSFRYTDNTDWNAGGANVPAADLLVNAVDAIDDFTTSDNLTFTNATTEGALIASGGAGGAGGVVAAMANATTFTNGAIGAIEFYDDGTDTFIRVSTAASTAFTAAADIGVCKLSGISGKTFALSAAGVLTMN